MEIYGVDFFEILKYFIIFYLLKRLWGKRESAKIILSTFRWDAWLMYVLYIKMLLSWMGRRRRNETICKCLDKMVREGGSDRPCFYFGDEIWTYKQVQLMSYRVANYFQMSGLKKGDAVGLAMTNRPEFIAIWLGLGRIGVVTVLINSNLRGESLESCISVVKCKAFIIGTEMRQAFEEICMEKRRGLLPSNIYELDRFIESPHWSPDNISTQNETFQTIDFAQSLRKTKNEPTVLEKGQEPNIFDPVFYVFTSGTTGVPKAVRCTHGRLFLVASIASVLNFSPKDISYSAVPMYHMIGQFGVVPAFCFGAPVVIVPKFSASNFWKDIHRYKATVCIYIGEICRFLHNSPATPESEKHTLRAMFGGGGLRPEVWAAFQKRFNIKQFFDILASTEGNCTMLNLEGKIGACGYIPIWFQPIHPIQLVKINPITGEICRNKETGLAIKCEENEPGELIGKIIDSLPMSRFDGYTDAEATKKKIVRNVFSQGDKYYRSGDSLSRDKYGYYYFHDRIGDTFRWKGENVATTLVERVISRLTGMRNNVVYGVKVPGTEGTACMAAIIGKSEGDLDLQSLASEMKKSLPKYAIPMFIRIVSPVKGLDMPGTFKFQKFQLREKGFEIESNSSVFIYSTETESYRKLNFETFNQVMEGNYRF